MRHIKPLPAQAELLALFVYDAVLGDLRWRETGELAGSREKKGYIAVTIGTERYKAHRLIWKMMTGAEPIQVDHENNTEHDNRWLNLRDASHTQNAKNRRINKNSTTGFKGVSRTGVMFRARARHNGAHVYLGTFATPEEAHAAYCKFADANFGEFARHG